MRDHRPSRSASSIPPAAIIRITVSVGIRPPSAIFLKDGADLVAYGSAERFDLAVLKIADSFIDRVGDDFGIVGDCQERVEIEIVVVSVGYWLGSFPYWGNLIESPEAA
jgi:hypothetical protein